MGVMGRKQKRRWMGPVAARFPEVESVKNDEQRHGDTVLALL